MSKNNFLDLVKETLENVSVTENGAVGFKTTHNEVTDFFYKISSQRDKTDIEVKKQIRKLFNSGDPYLLKFIFYVRDIESGLGERRLFRLMLEELLKVDFDGKDSIFKYIITKWIPIFGRFDDAFVFIGTKYEPVLVDFVRNTLISDLKALKDGKNITLLAKWMPSMNASNKKTREMGEFFAKKLKLSPRNYRKTLSKLREYNNIVERSMCSKEWDKINYNFVPSKANIKYKSAFLTHDYERRTQFLLDLSNPKNKNVKINSKVNYPYEVLHMYSDCNCWGRYSQIKPYDMAVEQLWKNLKEVEGLKDTIVVRDDSGSMFTSVGKTKITAYEVATALGIYCAEHNSEAYKNKIISFSNTPRYLDFSSYASLHDKYAYLNEHSEISNTNIEAVFDLILDTAKENKLKPEELPKQILILSDMEFDDCACSNSSHLGTLYTLSKLFAYIRNNYEVAGYKMPKLIFWNLCSRTETIPMKENENGVLLVSGFSQNVLEMIIEGKKDTYSAIVNILEKPRYEEIPLFTQTFKKEEAKAKNDYKSPLELI